MTAILEPVIVVASVVAGLEPIVMVVCGDCVVVVIDIVTCIVVVVVTVATLFTTHVISIHTITISIHITIVVVQLNCIAPTVFATRMLCHCQFGHCAASSTPNIPL